MIFGLDKPENFSGDSYGYITNQLSHCVVGMYLITSYCYLLYITGGEYPEQTLGVILVPFGYLLLWEIMLQGWRGLDSLEDTFYVFLGSFPYLIIEMDWVIGRLFWWFTVAFAIVLIRGYCVGRKSDTREIKTR